MLITRTPLRISIGGGGTDLPSYYRSRGGFLIAGAIDKYIYLALNQTFTNDYFLKYSEVERVAQPSEIRHPILREALTAHDVGPGIEIVSMADIPAGTGLGSSGTFTVGLLRALHAHGREHVTMAELAEEACSIEIDRLCQPVGKQDQYVAAYGGLTCFEFHPDDTVTATPLGITDSTLHTLEEHLLLFFTGYSREATSILRDQQERSLGNDAAMLANLDHTKELGYEIKGALEDGDCERYAKLMHEHWIAKRERTPGMSNGDIDGWYEATLRNGALGGKLVGAGAGGFLLLYAADPPQVRRTMAAMGLSEVRFVFDHDGSTVQTRG